MSKFGLCHSYQQQQRILGCCWYEWHRTATVIPQPRLETIHVSTLFTWGGQWKWKISSCLQQCKKYSKNRSRFSSYITNVHSRDICQMTSYMSNVKWRATHSFYDTAAYLYQCSFRQIFCIMSHRKFYMNFSAKLHTGYYSALTH